MHVPPRLARVLVLVLLALACWLISWAALQSAFFGTLERKTVDFRFRLLREQTTASKDIVVVAIDEASIRDLEPLLFRWPWPRDAHATFLNFMARAGARLVVFDLLFVEREEEHPERDLRFAEAAGQAGNVILVVHPELEVIASEVPEEMLLESSIPAQGSFFEYPYLTFPYPELAREALRLGHNGAIFDEDGPLRRTLLLAAYKDRLLPSLSLATALAALNVPVSEIEVGNREVRAGPIRAPLDEEWMLPIWFNGGPGTYSPTWQLDETDSPFWKNVKKERRGYSYRDVFVSELEIEDHQEPHLDPALFENKIVMVGTTAASLHDIFTTPYAGGIREGDEGTGKMSGVEVHAHIVDNLLHNRFILTPSAPVSWVLVLGAGLGVLCLVFFTGLWTAGSLSVVLFAGYLWVNQWFFSEHWQLPVVPVTISWATALAFGLAYQYWVEGAEKRKVKQIFSRFVSRDVYKRLLSDPAGAELGGQRALVTVLFSDLRGFTSMSENRQPEEIVTQLNEYFTSMVEIVFEHRGTIDKFVGDMIMALFSAPLPDEDHADHAVQCAIAMHRKLVDLNLHWKAQGRPSLRCGVGINSGEMVAGIVGAETVRSYTVIGDNVNLGARLESLCKEHQADIIISEFTRKFLKHEYPMQELGEVLVKGKSRPVKIFRVFPEAAESGISG